MRIEWWGEVWHGEKWPRLRMFDRVLLGDGCWLWLGSKSRDGYGVMGDGHGQSNIYVHRIAYELLVGPIPDGWTLDHLCRNTSCVNPDHLEPVPLTVNMARGEGIAAVNARKTHCVNGHEYTEENTYRSPKRPERRDCLRCRRDRDARRWAA